MDSLLKESQLREKQGILFDKNLSYVKTKVLRPSLLGGGNLGKTIFSELKTILKSIQNNMKKYDLSHAVVWLEEIEAAFDDEEQSAKEKYGYIPFHAAKLFSDQSEE